MVKRLHFGVFPPSLETTAEFATGKQQTTAESAKPTASMLSIDNVRQEESILEGYFVHFSETLLPAPTREISLTSELL